MREIRAVRQDTEKGGEVVAVRSPSDGDEWRGEVVAVGCGSNGQDLTRGRGSAELGMRLVEAEVVAVGF